MNPRDDPSTPDVESAAHVEGDQERWRATRAALNAYRPELTRIAARLYPPEWRVAGADLLAPPGWIPPEPIPLAQVALTYQDSAPPPTLTGAEPAADPTRPLESRGERYRRYSDAMRDLARPRLFEDRVSYRLLDFSVDPARPRMACGRTTYFEQLDVVEPLAHEAAMAALRPDGRIRPPSWPHVPFRRLLDDPFDLNRRALLPSIDTLTIRWDRRADQSTFVLHRRDPGRVAIGGGTTHVMPCGVFQPSSPHPAAGAADFSLWRCVMREYAEEFLGHTEKGSDGRLVDYESGEPFRTLELARADGRLRIFLLGLVLDALTLVGEILTVCVLEAEVYDAVFAGMVTTNAEGSVAGAGLSYPGTAIPFTEAAIQSQIEGGRLAPAAVGCLRLALAHRALLFDGSPRA